MDAGGFATIVRLLLGLKLWFIGYPDIDDPMYAVCDSEKEEIFWSAVDAKGKGTESRRDSSQRRKSNDGRDHFIKERLLEGGLPVHLSACRTGSRIGRSNGLWLSSNRAMICEWLSHQHNTC